MQKVMQNLVTAMAKPKLLYVTQFVTILEFASTASNRATECGSSPASSANCVLNLSMKFIPESFEFQNGTQATYWYCRMYGE